MIAKITILEGQAVNPGDLSWKEFEGLGQITVYNHTTPQNLISRSKEANILVTNKLRIGAAEIEQLPNLTLICQLATGYDNIDIVAAKKRNITVCNAVGYSTDAVAQHVMALLLARTNHVTEHNQFVQADGWSNVSWSHSVKPLMELKDLTMGIYGFGKIGQKVSCLAEAFGMRIITHTRSPKKSHSSNVEHVSLENLFAQSDVISLHAPLTVSNKEIVDHKLLSLMRSNAILINTGRGGLINEEDLRQHLIAHPTQSAALDVLSVEPPIEGHPLIGLNNCIITPHNAWAAKQSRARLIQIVLGNIEAFIKGNAINMVN